jgi:hypothetical protein
MSVGGIKFLGEESVKPKYNGLVGDKMEFLLGAMTTIAAFYVTALMVKKIKMNSLLLPVGIYGNQTARSEMMLRAGIVISTPQKPLVTQATKFHDNTALRVVLLDDKAYWIQNQRLVEASHENGKIAQDTIKLVDTMAADSVELKKISIIVSKLTGEDDATSGRPGDKRF